jgi:hypothetical protein
MTAAQLRGVGVAALVAGAGVVALVLASDHQDARVVWAIFGPAVGWCFVGTGLYAWRRRPESRIGVLMVLLGFAWFLSTLGAANSQLVFTIALVTNGLWGGVFLHLGMSFPTGRLTSRLDRALVIAGYVIIPGALIPAMFFAGPHELGCDRCPPNLLLVRHDADLASVALAFGALLYVVLFLLVLIRSIRRWRRASPVERLQLTPVYVSALLTFLLVVIARAGAGDSAWWAAFISSALLPFAFLGGLLRSHVSHLDAELADRLEELRASRARIVEAGDAERRRLERDLHDGRSRGWSGCHCSCAPRGRARPATTISRACSTARRRSCGRASPSCASSRAESTRPCSPSAGSSRRCTRSCRAHRCP